MMVAFWSFLSLGRGLVQGSFPLKKIIIIINKEMCFSTGNFLLLLLPPISNTPKLGCGGAKARPKSLLTGHSGKGGQS